MFDFSGLGMVFQVMAEKVARGESVVPTMPRLDVKSDGRKGGGASNARGAEDNQRKQHDSYQHDQRADDRQHDEGLALSDHDRDADGKQDSANDM